MRIIGRKLREAREISAKALVVCRLSPAENYSCRRAGFGVR
jgi:hypothetical protein